MQAQISNTQATGPETKPMVVKTMSACALCAILFLLSFVAHAQYRGSLRGQVTDQQGAIVPGATITLTDTATNAQKVSTAGEDGLYTFSGLSAAQFSLTAEKTGFKKKLLASVKIIPDQLNELNIQLEVGDVQQTVTVSGQTQALDSETATVSSTITSNQIQHLPSFNRDIFQLAQLTPGVFGDGSQAGGGGSFNLPGNQGPGGTGGGSGGIFQTENGPQIQTRGGQYETNSVTVDGISTVSAVWGGTSIITPSEDSVDNLKVVSNSYDAENGRFSGAQIQVTSKSGSNAIHGSAFFKASRPGLNAYQRWNGPGSNISGTAAARGVNRDDNQFNQYGGSLGGPLWKDRIFAFFNWETSPSSSAVTAQGWYETSAFDTGAAATGSIASQYLSHPGEGVSARGIIQRSCASIGLTEGVNCNTTASGLDVGSPLKTGLGLQDLSYGGSNSAPGLGGGLDGVADMAYFTSVNPTNTSQMQYNGRVDADATHRDHLSFTIYWVPVSTTDFNGPIRSANLWHHSQINDAFAVIWNHTFSPTLLNEARANAAGWRWNEVGSNPQEPFGLPEANIDDIGNIAPDGDFKNFGAPGPSNLNQWTYTYNDVLTKVAGRHNIKMGGELTRLYYLNNPVYAARPSFNFHNLWDFANDAPYFESGQFDSATGVPFANRQDDRVNVWGFFAQDDFKVLPNLTINVGLRWSYFGSFYSKENNLDVLRLGSGADALTGMNIRVGGSLYQPQKTNFGPQFGFAYQPTMFQNKMVVRGGFGINYNQNEIAITANGNGNPPNAVNASFTCPYPFTDNPSCAGNGILYQTATNINSIFGYAPNPATITTFGANNLPLTGTTSVTGFPSRPKTISNYHFSLDVQYQLPYNTVASVQYQGSLSRHVLIQNNQNAIAAANGVALNPTVNFVDYYDNAGSGNFHSGIASLNHNFAHGFQAEALYTWAKAMDENSGPYSEDYYPFNTHAAYGRSDYNVQNAFKIFGLWQPTLFHGDHGWLEKAAGGWSLSGIWNVHTGFPWNPVYNTVSNTYYQGSGYSQLRPVARLAGAGNSTDNSTYKSAVNPNFGGDGTKYFLAPTYVTGAVFPNTSPAPAPGMFRNSLNSPGYNGLDASLTKAFGLPNMKILGENAKFEIRADTYNLLNKTNINATSINTNLGTVNPDGTTSPNAAFGVAGSALASRTVQLQARFSF
jgi:Carboxypeptidase regulatory-like domain